MKFKELFGNSQRNFYFLLILGLITILFTHPFLRYPYDMFSHLLQINNIDRLYISARDRILWHQLWANFFDLLVIPTSEIFLRAKIIHVLQIYIAFFSIFFFSKVMIRNIFNGIDKTILNYLSLWSTIIWFSIFATFSVHYHQVWYMWYSVNYQITLPLFWYITALTLILFLEEISTIKKIFFTIQILVLARIILQIHSMEFLYYLMYLLIFGIIYLDKVYYFFKKYFYITIPIILTILYFVKKYQPEKSKIFNYLDIDKLPTLYHDIISQGHYLITTGLNRANASLNELMVVIFYFSFVLVIITIIRKFIYKDTFINIKQFVFLMITSLFVLIPVYTYSAGLFAIITRSLVVNRFYYSSSLFIIIPIFIYSIFYLKDNKNINILKINLSFILILSSVWFYSKYYTTNQVYYKNVTSIKNSFFEKRVGFHISTEQINLIGEEISADEKENKTGKIIYYFARADIAFVIKHIYRKNIFWQGVRFNPNYIKLYKEALNMKKYEKYHLILFETPDSFPEYKPFE